ncbi:MAG: LpqB family beta-propeller domain-containing protein [Bifidobacteriaceae bacterium]|nr:LpqB family beta-propeller domain-containing protein [Bifidobacteriaceae bacterium]
MRLIKRQAKSLFLPDAAGTPATPGQLSLASLTGRSVLPARPVSQLPCNRLGRGWLIGLVALACLLSGCAKLPTSGPVYRGIDPSVTVSGQAEFLPMTPAPAAGPVAIVEGFLQAVQAGPPNGYAAARRYLAQPNSWQPTANVRLYESAKPPEPPIGPAEDPDTLTTATVELPFEIVATVDQDGHYQTALPERTSIRFELGRDSAGSWRITEVPAGIVLSVAEFASQFRKIAVYFPDPTSQILVPDIRWFPRTEAARLAVEAFVAGPPSYLADAVVHPLPPGSVLESHAQLDAVGHLVIRLAGAADWADQEQRSATVACLVESLTSLADVNTVEVKAGNLTWQQTRPGSLQPQRLARPAGTLVVLATGTPPDDDQATAEASYSPDADAWPDLNLDQTADAATPPSSGAATALPEQSTGPSQSPDQSANERLLSGYLATVNEGHLQPLTGFRQARERAWQSLALAPGSAEVAGLSTDGQIWRSERWGDESLAFADAPNCLAPVYDRFGWLWTAAGGVVWAAPPAGAVGQDSVVVANPWPVDSTVLALAPARDGARIAVVVRSADGQISIQIVGVRRDYAGQPRSLAEPLRVSVLAVQPVSFTWADEETLMVLAPLAQGQTVVPRLLTTGGPASELPAPGGATNPAVGLAVGASTFDAYVATADNVLYSRLGQRWAVLVTDAALPCLPA